MRVHDGERRPRSHPADPRHLRRQLRKVIPAHPRHVHHEAEDAVELVSKLIVIEKTDDDLMGHAGDLKLKDGKSTSVRRIGAHAGHDGPCDGRHVAHGDGKPIGPGIDRRPGRRPVRANEEDHARGGLGAAGGKERFRVRIARERAGDHRADVIGRIEHEDVPVGRRQHRLLDGLHVAGERGDEHLRRRIGAPLDEQR